ncbi:putative ribonuclease H-like domain-containing protein [Tanacetum coccineum]
MESQSETTQTVSALKLPVLKTGEYDLKVYVNHDPVVLEVIVNCDSVSPVASASTGVEGPIPPKTAEQKLVRKNELKAKSTLMLAIPNEHLLKFHACKDAKSLWEAIKKMFGGNKESKKMQKTILKQNYENFIASSQEGLDKTYDRFQKLINNSSSTNEIVNTTHSVSAASSKNQASTASYVDDVMFSFFSNQSNASQLYYEYLEQIDADDLEEMDLKWQVAMLTMRVKRFIKKMRRKMDLKDKETVGFDRTKVEYYNFHMRGHFAREYRAPRNQGNRNRDVPRRNAPVDTSTTNVLVVQDGIGSSSSDSEVHTCSKDCLTSYETLQKQYDQQREALNKSNLEIIGYQMGLESLEARIVVHEKNEAVYEEYIAFLKYDVQVKDISIKELKNQLENALKEKDDLKLKLEKFETSSKNLTKLINSQITAKDKTDLGFDEQVNESEVLDNVFDSHESDGDDNPVNDRFKKSAVRKSTTSVPETETSISKTSKDILEKPKTVRPSAPIIEEWDTDSDNDSVFRPKSDQTKPKFTKINFVKSGENVKSVNKENTHRKVEYPRKSQSPRDNRDDDSETRKWVNNVTTAWPKAVVSAVVGNGENAVKSSAGWIWRPTRNVIDHNSKYSGSYMLKRFDYGNPQYTLQDQGIFDSGCSRHMTGNKFFLIDYQEINGGFVAFGGSPKGGKIIGKGKIRTGKLDFEDVYFVKELKFNLFSVSQMCDKKNSVLFTETECLVLSSDFKLLDESQVLLKVPRHDNMYSFDLKNVVPSGGLTCLFAKATIDESDLWHRRLGHINFKTMNKLVRGNLVRGLPLKIFENDHTCVACQKAEAVSTACYVQNRVLVTKPHNKTPYELLHGRPPSISFMRPFGCPVTILNTLDPLVKFDRKVDEGFFVGYSINSKAFRDAVVDDASKKTNEEPANEGERNGQKKERRASNKEDDQNVQDLRAELDNLLVQQNFINANDFPTDPLMPDLEDTTDLLNTSIFSGAYDDKYVGAEADLNTLETTMNVSHIPTNRMHKDHPKDQIIKDINSATQTRRMTKISEEHALSAFLYGTIEEEVYVCQPPGFENSQFPDKVYKVKKALYGLHQAPKAWTKLYLFVQEYVDDIIFGSTKKSLCVEFEQMMHKRFQMSSIGELTFFLGLQVKQKDDGIFINQDKYVADILKKFDFATVKTTSTPIDTNKALLKDEEAEDIRCFFIHIMIGSLMFQVTPKVSHLHAVKRIFRYLKGQPKLGLWYPRDSPFDLEAFSDSDYAGASLDRKSTTGGCQFLGKRLISWQCKKQTIVANSTTEAEYVAAANCCGQVLWIQNQMLDYGFNFMNTKIHIDNESTICIVKNPVFHAKTKHIEIRHHFIRDSYEKRLIQVIKIHTDHNVADLLTKAFDVSSISNEFGVKTGGCKVNAARQDLVLLGKS